MPEWGSGRKLANREGWSPKWGGQGRLTPEGLPRGSIARPAKERLAMKTIDWMYHRNG